MRKITFFFALALGIFGALPASALADSSEGIKDSTRTQAKVIQPVDIGQIIDQQAKSIVAAAAPAGGGGGLVEFFKAGAGRKLSLHVPMGSSWMKFDVQFDAGGSSALVTYCNKYSGCGSTTVGVNSPIRNARLYEGYTEADYLISVAVSGDALVLDVKFLGCNPDYCSGATWALGSGSGRAYVTKDQLNAGATVLSTASASGFWY